MDPACENYLNGSTDVLPSPGPGERITMAANLDAARAMAVIGRWPADRLDRRLRHPFAVMTIHDYHETMKKSPERTVRVATLKARLSEYLRAARRGHPVVVYDRDTPIARLVPYQASEAPLAVRRPLRPLREVGFPPPLVGPVDSLRDLMEERQSSR